MSIMRANDYIWLLKNLKYNRISFKIYLKYTQNIILGKSCKILRYCELGCSKNGKIIINDNIQ